MSRKMTSTTIYIRPDQDERLKRLHDRTKVPTAERIRVAIDALLDAVGEPRDQFEAAANGERFDLAAMLRERSQ